MWPSVDWQTMLSFSASPVEIIFRGSIMFWFLFVMFRFLLRRDIGNVGLTDFLLVVIVADASQNAMSADAKTVLDGLLLVGTLIFWNYLSDVLSYYLPWVRHLMEPPPLPLFKDGHILWRNLRREYITRDELLAKIREDGLSGFDEVKEMRLESDGEISIIPRKSS